MNLSEHIRQRRKQMEKTLREFADEIGIDFVRLSRIENGRIEPDAETLHRIATNLLTDGAFQALKECAENPVVSLHIKTDPAAIIELSIWGFVAPDGDRGWYDLTPAGFEYARSIGLDCSWWFVIQSIRVAA